MPIFWKALSDYITSDNFVKFEMMCCDLIYIRSKVKDVKIKLKVELLRASKKGGGREGKEKD